MGGGWKEFLTRAVRGHGERRWEQLRRPLEPGHEHPQLPKRISAARGRHGGSEGGGEG